MKKLLQAYQDGTKYTDIAEMVQIAGFIREKQTECPAILYRGLKLAKNEVPCIGQEFNFKNQFESFSEDIETAKSFSLNGNAVVVRLLESQGLPIYEYTENANETEWLVLDKKYQISSVEYDDDEECTIVDIQTAE